MALIDNGIYVTGQRTSSPQSLDETYQQLRECAGMASFARSYAAMRTRFRYDLQG